MTLEQRIRFLAALEESACIACACRHAGVARRDAYHHRQENPEFERLWRQAADRGIARLEKALQGRAR